MAQCVHRRECTEIPRLDYHRRCRRRPDIRHRQAAGTLPATPADTCSAERPAPSSPNTGLPLQLLNAHPRDARICFVEQGHIYFLDNATQLPLSVSGVWQKFFAKFDAEYIVNRFFEKWASDDSSKYYEVIKQSREAGKDDAAIMHQIKDAWTLKGEQASERGTYMHLSLIHI